MRSVICLWQYDEKAERKWKLVESFLVDGDGYPVVNPTNISGNGRACWNEWMNKVDEDGELVDELMGRAITLWDVGHGVQLMDFHPPAWVEWLASGFDEKLRKLPNWYDFFEEGHSLYFGTQKAAIKLHEKS